MFRGVWRIEVSRIQMRSRAIAGLTSCGRVEDDFRRNLADIGIIGSSTD